MRRSIPEWVLVGIFGLFFAYDVWEGIGNFVGVQYTRLSFGFDLTVLGWIAIIAGVVVPVVLFVVGMFLTKNLSLPQTVMVFVALLVVSAVVGADLALGVNEGLLYSVQ